MSLFSSRPPFKRKHWESDRSYTFVDRPQNNPTNPILTALREDWEGDSRGYGLWFAVACGDLVADGVELTSEQRIHARLVLERLASLSG